METTRKYRLNTMATEIIMIIVALLFLVPFYFLFVNSVKTFGDLLTDSAGLPTTLEWSNYSRAWDITNFPQAFWNSLVVTVASNLSLAMLSAMTAYQMVRRNTRFNQIMFALFVAAMVIPFQSIMIPLVKVTATLGINNSLYGLIICYLGFGVPLSVFLFHGFVKSIPMEIEEAATVDGSSGYGVFFRVVFPLMKPMFVTVIILNTLWIWNDYLAIPDPAVRRASDHSDCYLCLLGNIPSSGIWLCRRWCWGSCRSLFSSWPCRNTSLRA